MNMKTVSTYTILLLLVLMLGGCATTNSASEETSSSLNAMQEQLNQILDQLDQTESSLNEITNADQSTLEDAYNSFTDDVSRTEEMKNEFEALVEEVREHSNAYLTEWEDQTENYENTQLRRGSERRLEEMRRAISDVRNNSGDVNRALENYLADIREIESYLDNDLTMDGVEAVYSISQDMEDSGDELRQEINTLQRSIKDAKSEMGEAESPGDNQ